MGYKQNIDGCLADCIGDNGLSNAELEALMPKADAALDALRDLYQSKSLELLQVPQQREDLDACVKLAERLKDGAKDIVFFGIGGSSLGAQALVQITGHGRPGYKAPPDAPQLHFLDNLDPEGLALCLETFDLSQTRFVVVSKSGGTAETLLQAFATLSAFIQAGLSTKIKENFAAIAEPGDNVLRRFAEDWEFPILDHNPGVGGRFSVLTNVGLLPAALAGLDLVKVREGAASVLDPILEGTKAQDIAPALGAAVAVGLNQHRKVNINVLMPYANRLDRFSAWYQQLWAESLGKEGLGTTPLAALGPVDQHSQLQLFLSGPNDKFHTLIATDLGGRGPVANPEQVTDSRLDYLSGKTIGDLAAAEYKATAETLIKNNCPTRLIELSHLDEQAMGALFMHFMLETIIAAHLMDVDPFNQPAVEEGKILARRYLAEPSP